MLQPLSITALEQTYRLVMLIQFNILIFRRNINHYATSDLIFLKFHVLISSSSCEYSANSYLCSYQSVQ
uniref:Uncharacterized protein n=1 Tax=Octopus bimaculoides TaxID=37653 RepID=A0A0L8GUH8_OCTBM